MKKLFILVALFSSISYSYSQIEQGNFQVSLSGNFTKTASQSGLNFNKIASQTKNFNSGLSFGYFISNNFLLGVGADYSWQNEVKQGVLFIDEIAYQLGESQTKARSITPFIFGEMYLPVVDKLYFSTKLKAGFGFVSSTEKGAMVNTGIYSGSDLTLIEQNQNTGKVSRYQADNKGDFIGLQLSPRFTYYFSEHFGLIISMGGIEYDIINWSLDNSVFVANFNPQFWELGVSLKF